MELNEYTEEQIIEKKEMFIKRLNYLMRNISDYLKNRDSALGYRIHEEYKDIKKEICDEAKYLNCRRNDIRHISKTHSAYSDGIKGASAFGFTVPSNGRIDQRMHSSVEEARYRLNKYFK